jgi:ATP-binding cassette, subfamily B, bacterial PglK
LNFSNNPYFNAIKNISLILDKDQKKRSLLMIGLLMVNALFDVFGLAAIFQLIDAALEPKLISKKWYLQQPSEWLGIEDPTTFLFVLSLIVFGIFLIKNSISILIFYIQSKFSYNIAHRLIQKVYKKYYDQGFLHIANTESGKKIYDIMTIPYYFATNYIIETLLLSTEIMVMILIFGYVLYSDPLVMVILLLVIIPVFLLVYHITKNKTKALGDQRNELYPKASSILLDSMSAYTDVKLGNKEAFFYSNFSKVMREMNDIDARQMGIYSKIHQRLNDVVLGLALALIFAVAYFFRESQTQVLAILSVFGLAAYRFLPSINRMMGSTLTLKNMSFVIEELKHIQGYQIEDFKNIEALKIKDSIKFENVSYLYPTTTNEVLSSFNLSISVGQTVGIIGSSGSGKTTFLSLFLRMIRETGGRILIDDQPLTPDLDASFQKSIGYVQQSVYIKNGSLIDNIAFGEDPAEIDYFKLEKAIKDAMLSNFVNDHPQGTSMLLGENGVKLSGGQRQRIGIARALYKNSDILLFDEATSALDHETEKAIVATIKNLTSLGKTIIIVAHRVTTLEMCDIIYELDKGKIVKSYSYGQVLEKVIS